MRRQPVVATPGREIAACDPRRRAMARRAQLVEARLGGSRRSLGLVELVLLEQRTTEHEVCVPDLVDEVLAAVEQPERVFGLFDSLRNVTRTQVDLRERGHRL